ncbi:MAG: hypothetical protein ACKOEO_22035 [Planctomycetaceae bacterium]
MESGKSDFGPGLFVIARDAYDAAVPLNHRIRLNHFAKKFRP